MADEPKRAPPQVDPAEGSPERIDKQLEKRFGDKAKGDKPAREPRSAGRPPHQAKEPGSKGVT